MTVRLLVADDHSVIREAIRMYFQTDPEIQLEGEARDGREAVELSRDLQPDVVLMDLLMPAMDGIGATRAIRSEMPHVEVVAMTTILESAAMPDAINAGAIACVLKDTQPQRLRHAILSADAGQVAFFANDLQRSVAHLHVSDVSPGSLDRQQRDLLRLIAIGRSNEEMTRDLGVDLPVLRSRVEEVLLQLGMLGRAQALVYAVQHGIASWEETPALAVPPPADASQS
jgi:NarL family two-component system response regulator LiaR